MRALLMTMVMLMPAAALAEKGRATVRHVPPAETDGDAPLRLVAEVIDAWTEARLVARYRSAGGQVAAFAEIPFERSSAGGYYATIPAADVRRPGVEYFIVGVLADGSEVPHFGTAQSPHAVRVEPPTELRWIEAERDRLHDRMARVRARTEAIQFGASDGRDYFIRGEVDWTSRLITRLYSFTLGYGFIEGWTPGPRDPDSDDPSFEHDARYGFAEVRVRMHRSVWVDGGVAMGFSHEGFSTGVRGQVVFGQEWRSCVQIGAFWLQDLDAELWLRMQWDTVPPFLMGARIASTRLPGSDVGGGAIITYDIMYPFSDRIGITASVSYAARGQRPGNIGGGLATSFEF